MQVPDVDELLDTKNAPIETVNRLLDELITTDDYIPPSPFMDLAYLQRPKSRGTYKTLNRTGEHHNGN